MKNQRDGVKCLSFFLAAVLFAAGCTGTKPAAATARPTAYSQIAPSATPEWQEETLDNPLDDWFDDGVFEGAPGTSAVWERTFDLPPLAAEDGLSVSLSAVRYVENYALVFAFTVVNGTEEDLVLTASQARVNGWMLEAIFTPLRAISAGETAVCALEFTGLTLAAFLAMQIHSIQQLSFLLNVTGREGTPHGELAINADALNEDAPAQVYDDAGTELLFDPVLVVYCGFDEQGYTMLFYAENKTDAPLTLTLHPLYNETVAGPACSASIAPGCRAMLSLLPLETLYENGMQELFFASVSIGIDDGAPVQVELF